MKRFLSALAFGLCLAGAFAQDADADWFWGKPISGIEWNGATHVDKKELDATVRPYIGKAFTDEVWSALQAQVYALDWFDSIDPAAFPGDTEKTKVIIRFTVTEKPSVTAIKVSGNKGLRTTEILDVVTEKIGDIYSNSKAQLDVFAIKKLYVEKGYPDASVTSATTDGDKGVAVNFVIDEGSQATVSRILFQGLSAFKEKTLKGQLDLKEAGFLQQGVFQEAKLATDRQKLLDYYRQRGYADVAVVDVLRSLEKDPKSGKNLISLTFVVNEGRSWRYGGVTITGNTIFSTERLMSFFTQQAGKTVNGLRFSAEKQAMDDLYYENGYIFNTSELKSARDESSGTISYSINIVERDRAHIESISFKGNEKTKDYVIAREIPLQVGDIFSKAKIIQGLRNLYGLQYFSAVQPELLPGSDENLMDLVIAVEEQSTADIQFGVTLSGIGQSSSSSTFPLSGMIKWNEKNFMGKGQTIGVELNASPSSQVATLSFGDNWLYNKPISGSTSLSFQHNQMTTTQDLLGPMFDGNVPDPADSSSSSTSSAYKMPYEYWAVSVGASGGYSFNTPTGTIGFSGGLISSLGLSLYDATKFRPSSETLREIANQPQWTNKIPVRVYINNLDLWYNPSSGFYASEKLTVAGLLPAPEVEAQDYFRSDTRLDGFVTLFDLPVTDGWNLKWVLGGHTALNAIFAKGQSEPLVSPTDDIRLDGTFVGRGWSSLGAIEGGRVLWDNWVELRMPIFEQAFWMDGFLDVDALQTTQGLVALGAANPTDANGKTLADLDWDNLAMSVGFGFRFTIPQFPFRFYFAKRFAFDGQKINWSPAPSNKGMDFVISISMPLN